MADRTEFTRQMQLPGTRGTAPNTGMNRSKALRIPHREILKALQDPALGIPGILEIYRRSVLPARTRVIHLLGRKAPARIIETLLGYEVKAHYKRIQCPDMVTARYLKLFSELGCRSIRLPYDPTVTLGLLPELERSVSGIAVGVRDLFPKDRQIQLYVIRKLYSLLRLQLKEAARNYPLPAQELPRQT